VQTIVLHPAINLDEGTRYVVALRDLRRADGTRIDEGGLREEDALAVLRDAKVGLEHVHSAWSFTVASERSLSERMLHIRDDAFAQLGDTNLADLEVEGSSPQFAVTEVEELPEDPRLLRRVSGRVIVPCYLTTPGCITGGRFAYGLDGVPLRVPGSVTAANFICNVPRSVLSRGPARPSLYGHGLLGTADGVNGGHLQALAVEHNIMLCATDWIGMSQDDIPNAVTILADLSRFSTLADRVQQGMLNFLYLGRAMIHPQGLSTHPSLAGLVDTSRLYYDGGSQGGIIGGALTGVAPDFTRAALGVPAMNYSILLQRSIDFDTYAEVMYRAYPDELERPLLLGLVQMLWDRAEANGCSCRSPGATTR
jgi:hypothetical protein